MYTVSPPIGQIQISSAISQYGDFILGPKYSILYYKLVRFLA